MIKKLITILVISIFSINSTLAALCDGHRINIDRRYIAMARLQRAIERITFNYLYNPLVMANPLQYIAFRRLVRRKRAQIKAHQDAINEEQKNYQECIANSSSSGFYPPPYNSPYRPIIGPHGNPNYPNPNGSSQQ